MKIDCEMYAKEILDCVKSVKNKKNLLIVTAGDNAASESYVKGKVNDCAYCGISVIHKKFAEHEILEAYDYIDEANKDDSIGGIIIQLPLPSGWNEDVFTNSVAIDKDVDGFIHGSKFKPCTPEGIMYVLHKELGNLSGKKALVIGRGKLVGKPIAQMLIDDDCTVTVVHSKTTNIQEMLTDYDIIVSAVGKPCIFDGSKLSENVVVIDCGVSKVAGHLYGDFYNITNAKFTPVPKGIGLMTRAMLMKHIGGI